MLYVTIRALARVLMALIFRRKVEGAERIPDGPVIICPNHIKWWDPVLVAASLRRKVHFMAKEELFRKPVLAAFFRGLASFPVRRGQPDREAIRHSLRLLERGEAVGVFIEGTRSRTGSLGPAEHGAALLAMRSGALVVPAGIVGDYKPFSRLRLRFGEPMTFAEGRPGPAGREEASMRIMQAIASLLQEP